MNINWRRLPITITLRLMSMHPKTALAARLLQRLERRLRTRNALKAARRDGDGTCHECCADN